MLRYLNTGQRNDYTGIYLMTFVERSVDPPETVCQVHVFKDLSNVYNIPELFKYWLIVNLSLFYSRYSLAVYHYLFPV